MFRGRQAITNSFLRLANRQHFLIGSHQQSQFNSFGNYQLIMPQQRFGSSGSMVLAPKIGKQQQSQQQFTQTSKMSADYDDMTPISVYLIDDGPNPEEFDFPVTDINEDVLQKFGALEGIDHLSPGVFPTPAFPVNGLIYGLNLRLMISLVCRRARKPDFMAKWELGRKPLGSNDKPSPAVNVWFMVHTASPFTFLTEKSLNALFGDANALPMAFDLSIQDENSQITCYTSHGRFKEANILGAEALLELGISINFVDRHNFFLYRSNPHLSQLIRQFADDSSALATTDSKKMAEILRFVRINNKASAPVFGSAGAAGADLCSAEDCMIPAKGKCLVSTGLQIALPNGHYGRIAPRSGLASKHFIGVGAGVIDEDYRGELKVLLFNFGDADFKVNVGDRIAQLVCERFSRPAIVEADNLDETERGTNGFGSTGGFNNGAEGVGESGEKNNANACAGAAERLWRPLRNFFL